MTNGAPEDESERRRAEEPRSVGRLGGAKWLSLAPRIRKDSALLPVAAFLPVPSLQILVVAERFCVSSHVGSLL
ncbi:hypothetical protein EYF80_036017 [Liparis tanakae]|uniref:Uncharacterized protein n=1 Tax=Liparis tanakae TaxID=230148 RepID=A0A4Z2GKI5_9TELE|nr:hypothetical protein EYF80_036017 [Liparis tanakae]